MNRFPKQITCCNNYHNDSQKCGKPNTDKEQNEQHQSCGTRKRTGACHQEDQKDGEHGQVLRCIKKSSIQGVYLGCIPEPPADPINIPVLKLAQLSPLVV